MNTLYLYAVVPADATRIKVPGVNDAPVEILAGDGDLAIVASDIEPERLAELAALGTGTGTAGTGAKKRPRAAEGDRGGGATVDEDAVARLATRHDEVIRAVLAGSDAVLPFRLGTVVTSREAGTRLLAERSAEFHAGLDRVAGCQEWGVELVDDSAQGTAGTAPATPPGTSGAVRAGNGGTGPGAPTEVGPGTAYLLRRRAQLAQADRRHEARDSTIRLVAERLQELAVDSVPGRARGGGNLLHRTYLVRRVDEQAFLAAVDRSGDEARGAGLALRLTGPWPPYSFSVTQLVEQSRG